MIYGLFVLLAGLLGLFFMFNTGQLTAEKAKLVNTADAVAYSAAVMHARALNFDAYTNRALMANEVMVAQVVSLDSWLEYAKGHNQAVPPFNCLTYYSVPIALALVKYEPLCALLAYPAAATAINGAKTVFDPAAATVMAATEVAKLALQGAQSAMYASFLPARHRLMQEVADANYDGDGTVKVDVVPLHDNYTLFDGKPFITLNTGNDRKRFRDAEVAAANLDSFVPNRSWSDSSPWPCFLGLPPRGDANRGGGTQLIGFDEWRANDSASLHIEQFRIRRFSARCRTIGSYSLGNGGSSARPGGDFYYSGVPNFYDVSTEVLKYTPENSDPDKRDPRLKFAIRLTRDKTQTMTSEGRSAIKPTGRMGVFEGATAKDVLAAVASSEVYFERPEPRADGRKELPSLFNPYWQAHLSDNSAASVAAAVALQSTGH